MTGPRDGVAPGPVLAIVGASGAVGTSLRSLLSTRPSVWAEVRLIGSRASAGRTLPVLGREVLVTELTVDAFEGVDVAVFATPLEVSRHWAPPVAERGTVVVDVSAAFHGRDDVPMVDPELNASAVDGASRGIIALPGATSLAIVDALAPLHRGWGLSSVVVTSCLAASVAGRAGVERLADERGVVAGNRTLGRRTGDVRAALADALPGSHSPFDAPLALNIVPTFGERASDGWTQEEAGVRRDLRRVLGFPTLGVSVTCVVVPVVTAHTVVVHAVFQRPVDVEQARQALVEAPSVVLVDDAGDTDEDPADGDPPTPVDAVGVDPAWAGRVRQNADDPTSIDMVLCSDNLRGGSALAAVQVAERVVARHAPAPRVATGRPE